MNAQNSLVTKEDYNSLYKSLYDKRYQEEMAEYQAFVTDQTIDIREEYRNKEFMIQLRKRRSLLLSTNKKDNEMSNEFLNEVFLGYFQLGSVNKYKEEARLKKFAEELVPSLQKEFAHKVDTDFEIRELIERLAEYGALSNVMEHIVSISKAEEASKEPEAVEELNRKENVPMQISSLRWKGDKSTEFVHLIYALHRAGYITNDSNEVTKIVETAAQLFNFKLATNWQSNLSKSYLNTNNDFEPSIFSKLKKAFEEERGAKNERRQRNRG